MLKGIKNDDRPADPRCLETREVTAVFLRLQSPRERVALPYSSLIKLTLKTDETALELSFVTHCVTITGKNLSEIYKAITEVEARLIRVVEDDFSEEANVPFYKSLVRAIRIEPLDSDERRKR